MPDEIEDGHHRSQMLLNVQQRTLTERQIAMGEEIFGMLISMGDDLIKRQQVLELVIAAHAIRITDNVSEQKLIVDGMAKHVKQFMGL